MKRSKFVTYWTGKDIEKDNPSNKTERYSDRLWSILEEGIWMNINSEVVHGWDIQPGINSNVTMKFPMVCFTELRLSKSFPHYFKYGQLGFVFDRKFVLDRYGAPVLYARSHTHENIVGNLAQVGMLIDLIKGKDQFKIPHPQHEEVLIDVGEWIDIHLSLVVSHVKAMSSTNKDDFIYLEENEWRIVHSNKLEKSGLLLITGHDKPKYKLKLSPKDIQLIIVPNQTLRDEIRTKDNMVNWFNGHLPPVLTINEISEF